MRMMLKVTIPVESGNKGIKDGSLPKTIANVVEQIKPEAAFFGVENGRRTGYMFFDLKDSSQMVPNLEPLMMSLNAEVTLAPVMNQNELKSGLEAWGRSHS